MSLIIQFIHTVFGIFLWGTGTPARYLFITVMSIISAMTALILFRALSQMGE